MICCSAMKAGAAIITGHTIWPGGASDGSAEISPLGKRLRLGFMTKGPWCLSDFALAGMMLVF